MEKKQILALMEQMRPLVRPYKGRMPKEERKMKRFFCVCCLLVGCLLLLPALGEDGGVGVTVGFRGNGREQVHYAITRPDLI